MLIGIMLGGIVAMQVSLLKLNTGISRAVQTTETIGHQNQLLRSQISTLLSAPAIRERAADMNLVDPAAGDTRFLTARGEQDAVRAVKRMVPPSDEARMVILNKGLMYGEGATLASLLAAQGEPTTTPVAQPQATPTPVATAAPQEPLPTPVPTVTPAATAVPTVDPATGLAPQG